MLRGTRILTAVFALFAALAYGAQARDRDTTWVAPADESTKMNPLADRPDAAAGGRKVFQQRCAACHGAEGSGTPKAPGLTGDDVQAQTDGALFWKISSGNARAGMPAFSFLPEPQRWQLVLHLRALAAGTALPGPIVSGTR
jgi:mono/diheme cytochrome c family protein